MIEASSEETIARGPEEVFDFVADPMNEPVWNPDAVSTTATTPPPVGLGSRRTSEYRHIGHLETEIVVFERPHRLVLRSVGRQAEMTLEFRFEDEAGDTRMLVEGRLVLKGALRFAEGVLRGSVQKQYAERAALIRRALQPDDDGVTPAGRSA